MEGAVTGSDNVVSTTQAGNDEMSFEQMSEGLLQVSKVDTTGQLSLRSTSPRSTPTHTGHYDTPQRSPFILSGGDGSGAAGDESDDEDDDDEVDDEDEDEMADHNPEPPAEMIKEHGDLINADTVGDTVYSKSWLFSALMKLIQVIERSAKESELREGGQDSGEESSRCEETPVDLEDSVQDELCKLWDMSTNSAVVTFLLEFKAVEILSGAIAKSKAPRATEICVGILGNMACNEEAAKEMSKNQKLIDLTLWLLNDADTPTLVETCRLIQACVSSKCARQPWLHTIRHHDTVFPGITFILCSSTNVDLLRNTCELIDKVLDVDEDLCAAWGKPQLISALLEAAKQVGFHSNETFEILTHILQMISTTESGVQSLVKCAEETCSLLYEYLVHICSDPIVGIAGKENVYASAFSVLNVIFESWEKGKDFILQDFQVMRCLLKILDTVYPKIHESKRIAEMRRRRSRTVSGALGHSPSRDVLRDEEEAEESQGQPSEAGQNVGEEEAVEGQGQPIEAGQNGGKEEEEDEMLTRVLYEALQGFTVDIIKSLPEEKKTSNTPKVLTYLDTCLRERLYTLVWTLQEVTSSGSLPDDTIGPQVALLQDIADNYSLKRLSSIIKDALDMG